MIPIKLIIRTISEAIDLALKKQDSYNLDRYAALLNRVMNDNKKITMAEYMDCKLYLGHSMD